MDCKIFVGNVPFDCCSSEFKDCFKHINGYVTADLINLRGFGFVVLQNKLQRDQTIVDNNFFIKNRKLRLSKYDNQTKGTVEKSSFIKLENISDNITRDDIYKEFKNLCEVGKCFIDTNRVTGEQLSTGLVEIFDVEVLHQLLSLGSILMKDKSEIILKPFTQNIISHKKKLSLTKEEYYEIYNAGRNAGLIEAAKMNITN
jgi:hypothetical protein